MKSIASFSSLLIAWILMADASCNVEAVDVVAVVNKDHQWELTVNGARNPATSIYTYSIRMRDSDGIGIVDIRSGVRCDAPGQVEVCVIPTASFSMVYKKEDGYLQVNDLEAGKMWVVELNDCELYVCGQDGDAVRVTRKEDCSKVTTR